LDDDQGKRCERPIKMVSLKIMTTTMTVCPFARSMVEEWKNSYRTGERIYMEMSNYSAKINAERYAFATFVGKPQCAHTKYELH
jgi:GTP cyclohydrolase FolE2